MAGERPGPRAARRTRLTRAERRVIAGHRTPQAVQRWVRSMPYNFEPRRPTLRTFRGVVRHRTAHCLEAALAAATILEHWGYEPLLLDLESQDRLDHVVFPFRQAGLWGAVGASRDLGLHGRRPVFGSVEHLVRSYYRPYIDQTARITAYGVADLRMLGGYDWRLAGSNVWKVEQFLVDLPHRPLESDDAEYRRLRQRYREYIASHPATSTPFTSGRHFWM